MRDLVVAAVADPHADGAAKEPPAGADDVVVDRHALGAFRFAGPDLSLADPHSARTQIVQITLLDPAIAAAAAQPDAVCPDVTDLAPLQGNVPRTVEHHDGGE